MTVTSDIIDWRTGQIRMFGRDLHDLSSCFERTGNAVLAAELSRIAHHLEEAAAEIRDAYRGETATRVQQGIANGERFMRSLISGALAKEDPMKSLAASMAHHLDTDLIEAREAREV